MSKMPYTFFGAADWDNDGHKDIVARQESTGDIMLFPGNSARGYSNQAAVRIGNGWQGYTPFGVADWDKDGRQDIVARQDGTGNLMLFPGSGNRGYSSAGVFKIGSGYNGYTPFGIGDLDKDGFQDLIVRNDATGTLYAHFGQGTRGYSSAGTSSSAAASTPTRASASPTTTATATSTSSPATTTPAATSTSTPATAPAR